MAEANVLTIVNSILRRIAFFTDSGVIKNGTAELEDLKVIAKLLESITAVLEVAEAEQQTNETIEIWLINVKDVVYDLKDLLDEVDTHYLRRRNDKGRLLSQIRHYLSLKPVNLPSGLSHRIKELRLELERILNKKLQFTLTKLPIKASRVGIKLAGESGSSVLPMNGPVKLGAINYNFIMGNASPMIIGREKEQRDITAKILSLANVGGPSVIAVVGIAGIGKTTLANLVYDDESNSCFDIKLWVSDPMKSDTSIPRLLQAIVKSATGEISFATCQEELVGKIKYALNDKRYFLVLDDVWEENNSFWVELMSVLDVGRPGSVILITTRSRKVASAAQSAHTCHLVGLLVSDSWSLFKQIAFSDGEDDRNSMLSCIGRSIVTKSDGVPLVVLSLGGLLRGVKDEKEWLQIDKMMNVPCLETEGVFPLLKLAYNKLLPSHLKPVFAHLALSLGDIHSVQQHQIFFWSAFGLLQGNDEKGDIYNCGQAYLMDLSSRSFIHDSQWSISRRVVSWKMHGLLQELAMQILGEDFAVITWEDLRVSNFPKHIVWGCEEPNALFKKDFPLELLGARKVRTFRFGYPMGRISQSFLNGIINSFNCLYILDLGFSHFEELPQSIEDMKHLRVLNISFNPIIKSLPFTIYRLLNLQAFFLEGCEQLQKLPSGVLRLRSLECFMVTTRSLVSTGWIHLPALKELQFLSCKGLVYLWDEGAIICLKSLRRLHFHDCPQLYCLPNSMKLLVNLEELVIANCRSLDLEKGEALSGLTSLQSLEMSGVQQLPHGIQSAANSLQHFLLRDCSRLLTLPNWLHSFVHLRSFFIYNCPNLLTLPEGFFLYKSLEELRIKGCPHLSCWCATIEGFVLIAHIPHIEIDGHLVTKKLEPDSFEKQMKLYLSLFPSDYEFERETLVQLWMAAGFLKTGHMEDIGRIYFDKLVEEGDIVLSKYDNFSGECKYTINSVKYVICNDSLYTILKDGNTEGESTAHRHVSVVSSYVDKTTFETLKRFIHLRTLLFIRNYGATLKRVPSDMFLALQCMEALDLSGSHITELPSSIGNATQLRYINLSFTLIERLPDTLDRLLKLQTLKLKGCSKLHNLPKEMRKLINLRHLCFDILGQLSFMPVGLGALTELRTLSAFIVDGNGGCNIEELRNMNNLSGSCCISGLENVSSSNEQELVLVNKKYLTQIQLRWDGYGATHEGNVSIPVWNLEPHSCLEKLEVFGYPNARLPIWMCTNKFQHLSSITFLNCENSKLNVCLGQLPNLKYLDIINMNRVQTIDGDILVTGYVSFPKLEKLAIDGMSSLRTWTGVSMRDFPLLTEFSMKHCSAISELPFLEFLGSLEILEISHCGALESLSRGKLTEKLKTLVIDSCPLLKTKCYREGEDWQKIQHVSEIWVDLENMHSTEDRDDTDEDSYSDSSLEEFEDIEEGKPGEEGTEASENGVLTNV